MNKKDMKKGNSILLIIALLITCIIPILFVMPVSAAPSTIDGIGWSDATLEVEIGDSIAAKVWGNANEFSGYTMYNMTFRWDPNVVNISQITNGDSVAWGTFINGTINNESGWVKQIEGQVSGGGTVSGNYTLFNITFDGIIVGTTNITFVDTLGQDGCILYDNAANPIDGDYRNATIRVYPAEPVTFTATRYNYTDINLTFTPGAGGNTTVIRGSTTAYPTFPDSGSEIYNGTLTKHNHTSLNPCETWFYSAWTYNITNGMFGEDCLYATAQTQCYTNFSFMGIVPENQTERSNCTSYDVAVNLTINNSRGYAFNWYINTSNGDHWSATGATNGSKGGTMYSLDHNTLYYWNVTVTDATGTGDSHSASYWFRTGYGGGTAPGVAATPSPSNGATSIPVNLAYFSCVVTDADGDPTNVTFYWANNTAIGTDTEVATGGTASITPTIDYLAYGTTYQWYVYTNDSCQQTRAPASGYWSFITDEPAFTITKDSAPSTTNSSIRYIINVTNNGEVNLTNVVVNETKDTNAEFWYSIPVVNGDTWWVIPYLNMTNASTIVVWYNITTCANGTSLSNFVNASNATHGVLAADWATNYTLCVQITERLNGTLVWNSTHANYTINVTNCGDIYLSNIVVNWTHSTNVSYYSSNYAPDSGNDSYNLSGLAPGATVTLYITCNTTYGLTGAELINQSKYYSNVTVKSNQTTPEITRSIYSTIGARTEMIRIDYDRPLPDMFAIGNNIFAIIGAIMIVGTVVIIIYVIKKSGAGGEE